MFRCALVKYLQEENNAAGFHMGLAATSAAVEAVLQDAQLPGNKILLKTYSGKIQMKGQEKLRFLRMGPFQVQGLPLICSVKLGHDATPGTFRDIW